LDKELTDDKEHKEVFTLRRMGTQLQTRVSQYFTNIEIEEEIENHFNSGDDDGEDDEGSETGFNPFNDNDNFN
jgi:hypothetical protein